MSALAKPPEAQPEIEGRVDAVANGRVYGWAWDRSVPGTRLEIQVRLPGPDGGRLLASGLADLAREDLGANGVGDGRHAFELALLAEAPADPAALLVVARDAGTGAELVLQHPSEPERLLEQAVSPHLLRLTAALEASRAEQQRLAARQQGLARGIAEIQERMRAGSGSDARLDRMATDLGELRERVAGLDIVLVRMDQTLRELAELGRKEGSEGRAMRGVALAALGVGLAVGLVGLVILRASLG
ncbi:hypothetical protein [Arenibaculum pallidiluteum]|uniref:hypothetical protein n=1 Tax=Arenibaculum pallidiluteum TaxID=2812559 RepID=UPI001A970250|nr:hypothetical protein [Arenibaculum pallidiluteum]